MDALFLSSIIFHLRKALYSLKCAFLHIIIICSLLKHLHSYHLTNEKTGLENSVLILKLTPDS